MSLGQAIVLLVALQRLAELALARRNARRLRAAGGVEVGAGHYPLFIALHGAWLATLFVVAGAEASIAWDWIAVFVLLQLARLWVVASLGTRWTTRIIVVPNAPLIRRGPYRFVRHPNYWVVAGEIAVLPLAFGAWEVALLFSALNGALLAHRIRVEDRALAPLRREQA